jgi:hypothetical protein
MEQLHFKTLIGEDGIIRAPAGVQLPVGEADVTVVTREPKRAGQSPKTSGLRTMIQELGRAAEELGIRGLPPDLAENHDHYAHGAPKRDPEP